MKDLPRFNLLKPALICLDYDGTLVGIKDEPLKAKLDTVTIKALTILSKKYKVAIITGRPVEFILNQLPSELSKLLIIAGIYGYEISYGHGIMKSAIGHFDNHALLEELTDMCARQNISLKTVENKDVSIAIHFRQQPELKDLLHKIASELSRKYKAKVLFGKMVVEIVPKEFPSKAHIVKILSKDYKTVLYAGDDLSDLQVFKYLKGNHNLSSFVIAVNSTDFFQELAESADITISQEKLIDYLISLCEVD